MKLRIFYYLIILCFFASNATEAQHKKITLKGLVYRVLDTYQVLKEDKIRLSDTLTMEVIYNCQTMKDKSPNYTRFEGKIFRKADSNFFRGFQKKHRFNYEDGTIKEYLMHKQNNVNVSGKIQDGLYVLTRGAWLPNKGIADLWDLCRLEITLIDTTAKIWDDTTCVLQDDLSLFVNKKGNLKVWGVAKYIYSNVILEVDASIISIVSTDYYPLIISGSNLGVESYDKFQVSPNTSATGYFPVTGSESIEDLSIFNSLGTKLEHKLSIEDNTLNLSAYPKGIYHLRAVQNNGKYYHTKLLIE